MGRFYQVWDHFLVYLAVKHRPAPGYVGQQIIWDYHVAVPSLHFDWLLRILLQKLGELEAVEIGADHLVGWRFKASILIYLVILAETPKFLVEAFAFNCIFVLLFSKQRSLAGVFILSCFLLILWIRSIRKWGFNRLRTYTYLNNRFFLYALNFTGWTGQISFTLFFWEFVIWRNFRHRRYVNNFFLLLSLMVDNICKYTRNFSRVWIWFYLVCIELAERMRIALQEFKWFHWRNKVRALVWFHQIVLWFNLLKLLFKANQRNTHKFMVFIGKNGCPKAKPFDCKCC